MGTVRQTFPTGTRKRATTPSPFLFTPVKIMSEDYQQLLVEATTATDRAESIRTLVKILADDGGKDFISRLDRKDGELCIEILDQVSGIHP